MIPTVSKTAMLVTSKTSKGVATLATTGSVTASPGANNGELPNVLRLPERLPFLLAGPALRRTDRNQVTVWLMTSVPASIEACLAVAQTPKANPLETVMASPEKLGERLFFFLIQFRSTDGFPEDKTLTYDLKFTLESYPGILGFTGGDGLLRPAEIAYAPHTLPTFVIPSQDRTEMTALHGSCRKLHGTGLDLVIGFDRELTDATAKSRITERPSALFLTGDQIYADDVAPELLPLLSSLGRSLLGWEESVVDGQRNVKRPNEIQPGDRKFVQENSVYGFTVNSKEAGSHLLSLGEFVAMYLLAWNPALWSWNHFYFERACTAWESEVNCAAMRRVLANIPSYMMFDDHEITDDWNLDADWQANAQSRPAASWCIANGLAAFWIFQGCGNDPGRHDGPLRETIVEYLTRRGRRPAPFIDAMLSYYHWAFLAPTHFPAFVLDTRTVRSKNTGKNPVELLDSDARRRLSASLCALATPDAPPFLIVSAAPIIGSHAFEAVQSISATGKLFREHPANTFDAESWFANENATGSLFALLAESGQSRFLFLSGDIHFGYTATCCVRHLKGSSHEHEIRIVQATSSALKNTPSEPQRQLLAWVERATRDYFAVATVKNSQWKMATGMEIPRIPDFADFLKWRQSKIRSEWSPEVLDFYWRYLHLDVESEGSPGQASRRVVSENNAGLFRVSHDGVRHVHIIASGSMTSEAKWADITPPPGLDNPGQDAILWSA